MEAVFWLQKLVVSALRHLSTLEPHINHTSRFCLESQLPQKVHVCQDLIYSM